MLQIDTIKENAGGESTPTGNQENTHFNYTKSRHGFQVKTPVDIMNEINERINELKIMRVRVLDHDDPDFYLSKLTYNKDRDEIYFVTEGTEL